MSKIEKLTSYEGVGLGNSYSSNSKAIGHEFLSRMKERDMIFLYGEITSS